MVAGGGLAATVELKVGLDQTQPTQAAMHQ